MVSADVKPSVPRLDGVDTLRGLSILVVILLHMWIRFMSVPLRLGGDWPPLLSRLVFHNGGNGVTLFFAISGFLITLTSLRRFGSLGAMRPAVFYRIRFARIMPLLLLLLAVLSVFHLAQVSGFRIDAKFFTLPRALLAALTFHLNWLEAARNHYLPAVWTVLWSLSIEEMFYLFFPLACVLLLRRSGRVGPWLWFSLAVGLVALGPFARTVWAHTGLQQENSYLAGMATIATGCMTAWLTERAMRRQVVLWRGALLAMEAVGWGTILLLALWPRWEWLHPVMHLLGKSGTDDTLLALGTCLVMAAVTLRGARGRAWSAPLRWLGRHSYEVYLSHEFVVMATVTLFAYWFPHGAARGVVAVFVAVGVGLTMPLGWALAKWFSEPMNRRLRGSPLLSELAPADTA